MKHQPETISMPAGRAQRNGPRSLIDGLYAWRITQTFAKKAVDDAALHTLLYAALQAPRPSDDLPAFAVVRSKPMLHALSLAILNEATLEDVGMRGRDAMALNDAAALALVFEDTGRSEATMNGWLTASALMMAAFGMGLGSYPTVGVLSVLEQSYWRDALDISAELRPVAAVALGWPSTEGVKFGAKSPNIVSWMD